MNHHFLSLASTSNTGALVKDELEEREEEEQQRCRINTEAAGGGASIPDLNVASVEEEEDLGERQGSAALPAERCSSHPDWLPQGWVKEVRTKEGGGRDKQYYTEPVSGRRFRSKLEVLKYLEASKGRSDGTSANGDASSPTPSWKEFTDKQQQLPFFMQTGLDDLRNMLVKGMPTSSPLNRDTTPASGFQDYLISTLGSSGRSSSWTDYFKLNSCSSSGSSFLNGTSSSFLQNSSGTSATPHWLDRILNKGPPVPPPPSTSGMSLGSLKTGGFVQSPLHYLHNAGAFQNSWLHIKPPSQTHHSTDYSAGDTWKSWPWFDKCKSGDEQKLPEDTGVKRREINLNQAFQPDDEEYSPRDDHARQQAGKNLGSQTVWEKPVTEHRDLLPHSNGAAAHQPAQKQQHHHLHQQHQQYKSKDTLHFDLGVRKASHKVDRHQEKKRMESLGKRVCHQSLTELLLELKDRSRISLNR